MEPEDLETASERDYNAMNSDENSKKGALEAVLDWDGPTDPNNPRNFKTPKKVFITACFASLVCISTFNSSVMSPPSEDLMQDFGISKEVSVLATSLFVLGVAVGPIIFGPASEVLGRKYPLSLGVFLFAIFSIPVAVCEECHYHFCLPVLLRDFRGCPTSNYLFEIGHPTPWL
ncbi:MFS transporter [Penicillium alfredii]|uniref:MFS transporter n=1 Tax=Penicillium alfredii TaxID=1506179 RepID=A0A9W9EN44_9EURO|nr:MFS transporter [Penicillium alfredii]KAJ5084769.1 MFS transporter [Penicillium alfredii]